MAHLTEFERKLDKLFLDRTSNLRAMLGLKKCGPKPQITRRKIDKAVGDLQDLASKILASGLAKKAFEESAEPKSGRKIIGRGWKRQQEEFDGWFNEKFPDQKELVYVFWNIAVLISVIASEAKQSLATGLLRHFVPRNDTLKIESRNSVSVRDNVIIWTCLIIFLKLIVIPLSRFVQKNYPAKRL